MRTPALWLLGLALLLGALSGVLWVWTHDDLAPALLSGAAVGIALVALYAAARGGDGPVARLLPESSLPVVVLTFGISMMLNGLAFGLWLILIGAEVALLGAIGLTGEFLTRGRAER